MPERYYGIRHHGPGSARAVVAALRRQPPDVLLVEGPPEADELVRWIADGGLEPPVALLGYATDDPRRAGFWPFAVFSPEWQAIRWAVEHEMPVRFFDLPYAYRAAEPDGADEPDSGPLDGPDSAPDGVDAGPGEAGPGDAGPGDGAEPRRPVDPIGELAAVAGYDDPERWWEDVVEHRDTPAFEAIAEAMAEIRAGAPEDPRDLVREAYMRTVLREVRRAHDEIAVVCGAWHVPALTAKATAKDDAALLRGRRKAKVAFTWVPWTYGRLASWRGYGAGVRSPGWYHHLFTTTDDVVPRWLVAAAGVLRDEGVPTSSAHVIEATRLAETLAALRGRPLAGLAELTEAAGAVMCDGDAYTVYTEGVGKQRSTGWGPVVRQRTWTLSPIIMDGLDDGFGMSFGNIEPAHKRFKIGIDTSASMGWYLAGGTQLTAYQGAAAMALITARTEATYEIHAFSTELRSIPITARDSLGSALALVKNGAGGGTNISLTIADSIRRRQAVDTFVIITDNEVNAGPHVHRLMKEYRQKMGIDARLVVMAMVPTEFSVADPNDAGMLDVSGFDTKYPARGGRLLCRPHLVEFPFRHSRAAVLRDLIA